MKQLWRRASGIIKDRNSILMASLSRMTKHRHPDLEAAVIRATSHDDSSVDYKNAQRVFMWVRTSPSNLIIFLQALTRRLERTQDWVVALKSLILLHGVFCTKAPGIRKIGRLPFDLSGFQDGYIGDGSQRGACSAFVQAYFVFSDLKSVTLSAELQDEMALPLIVEEKDGITLQLGRVKRWQALLHAVLLVRPDRHIRITDEVVVLEAMDCMVIEVFELCSKICDGIAKALMKIYSNRAGKVEASMALDVLQRANKQGEDLSDYFEFCQKIGLLHATECLQIQQTQEEDLIELKKIINGNGVSPSTAMSGKDDNEEDGTNNLDNNSTGVIEVVSGKKDTNHMGRNKPCLRTVVTDKWVVSEKKDTNHMGRNKPCLRTVVTDKWEVFDEDISQANNGGGALVDTFTAYSKIPSPNHFNPFVDYEGKSSQHVLSLL